MFWESEKGSIIMKNVVPGVWVWEVDRGEPHVPTVTYHIAKLKEKVGIN